MSTESSPAAGSGFSMFTTVLVANRGEIARRVARTARDMGCHVAAVFVDADAEALHVAEADVSVRVESYLDGEAIIAAAIATGAQAIHPGYGYLAENAAFAAAVEDAGLVWIGPTPDVITAMGDKIEAKSRAVDAGVPVLPSTDDPAEFASIGFPLLIKAAAGGGGKGMRIVASADELDDAVTAAQREALNGFGDDRVFAERYVASSRHIEIQIMGDSHGNLVHLGERECSIQRRHQKIIEEAPSPVLDDETREAMGAAAVDLASALGYRSAGTVEFLVDDATGEFFFLEVNTRLQVEHPVTEQVTGLDLVRAQLVVAAGAPLEFTQDDITLTGHSIEARLYAEDPANEFLPATGTLDAFEFARPDAVRVDSAVAAGSVVGTEFDPMIAKVTSTGPTRADAAAALALALEEMHLGGVTTNRDFLAAALRTQAFIDGDTTTDFIDRVGPAPRRDLDDGTRARLGVAVALWLQAHARAEAPVLGHMPSGFRTGRLPPQQTVFTIGDETLTINYQSTRDGGFVIGADAGKGTAVLHGWTDSTADVEWNGLRSTVRLTRAADTVHVSDGRGTFSFGLVPRFVPPEADVPSGALVAPMPGRVVEVRAEPGDVVAAGDVVVVLEAMKMEHHLRAPHDGTITELRAAAGDQVENGSLLLVIDDS